MSKDIIDDIEKLRGHPDRINKLVDRIIDVINYLRNEGYELYEITTAKQQEYSQRMQDIELQYKENSAQTNDSAEQDNQYYRDAQESDFYSAELKQKYEYYENRLEQMNKCRTMLDDISQQVVSITKVSEAIKQKSDGCNNELKKAINDYIALRSQV